MPPEYRVTAWKPVESKPVLISIIGLWFISCFTLKSSRSRTSVSLSGKSLLLVDCTGARQQVYSSSFTHYITITSHTWHTSHTHTRTRSRRGTRTLHTHTLRHTLHITSAHGVQLATLAASMRMHEGCIDFAHARPTMLSISQLQTWTRLQSNSSVKCDVFLGSDRSMSNGSRDAMSLCGYVSMWMVMYTSTSGDCRW